MVQTVLSKALTPSMKMHVRARQAGGMGAG